MKKNVLVVGANGSQAIELLELPDNWDDPAPPAPPSAEEQIATLTHQNEDLQLAVDMLTIAMLEV